MKSALLFVAITIGLLFPQISQYAGGIRGLVMVMLVQGFLVINYEKDMFSKELIFVLVANLIIPVPAFYIVQFIGERQAEAAYLIAAAPAAVASPIMIAFIKKRTDFVTMSVVTTNLLSVLTLPIAIPLIAEPVEMGGEDSEWTIIMSVIITIIIPLVIALLLRKIGGWLFRAAVWTRRYTLYVWLCAIALACSKARSFVSENDIPSDLLVSITAISGVLCIINFGVGYLVGGSKFPRESSQSLGQKNTMFAVWVGLTFLNPISVIAPVAYIIFQNIYNALQIYRFERQEKRSKTRLS